MNQRAHERLLDANANRAAEGLRVLEDVARFQLETAELSGIAKRLRHQIRSAMPPQIVAWRDAGSDVGEAIKASDEGIRETLVAVIRANAARAQEALRVLEEGLKLAGYAAAAGAAEAVRYSTYRLESDLLSKLPAWMFWRVRLYVLVDVALCADPVRVAVAAVRGGAGAVQLRAKNLPVRVYRELAARMQDEVRAAGALFVVNDHVAVARAISADAIHVGQEDLDPRDVRSVVGPQCAIGVSTHAHAQVIAAQHAGADYLGIGPMYATATKPHEPCQGPGLLDAVRESLTCPNYAIGGIDLERLRALRGQIPHGIAVAGVVCKAADPERAAAELMDVLQPEDA
ncbi:MAG: thiamine phosphate synthase [Planctomycetota bacterium]